MQFGYPYLIQLTLAVSQCVDLVEQWFLKFSPPLSPQVIFLFNSPLNLNKVVKINVFLGKFI